MGKPVVDKRVQSFGYVDQFIDGPKSPRNNSPTSMRRFGSKSVSSGRLYEALIVAAKGKNRDLKDDALVLIDRIKEKKLRLCSGIHEAGFGGGGHKVDKRPHVTVINMRSGKTNHIRLSKKGMIIEITG